MGNCQISCIPILEDKFEALIASYIEGKVGLTEGLISVVLAEKLMANVLALEAQNRLTQAGIGGGTALVINSEVRKDAIFWLDKSHQNPAETEFLELMENFIIYLNATCYTGITGYEFHYTLYEVGSYYKRHLDQFQTNDSRQFSVISYLNEGWTEEDGGQLVIYDEEKEYHVIPSLGRTVMFRSSEMPHEVLPTYKRRVSVTGWLKR